MYMQNSKQTRKTREVGFVINTNMFIEQTLESFVKSNFNSTPLNPVQTSDTL